MEEITADYWKDIVRGVLYMLCATLMVTTQTSMVKLGSMIGYSVSVVVIIRCAVQFVCCFIEASISTNKRQTLSAFSLLSPTPKRVCCDVGRIYRDMKHVGIVPRRTLIPIFHETLSTTRTPILTPDYGSFRSSASIQCLTPPMLPAGQSNDSPSLVAVNTKMNASTADDSTQQQLQIAVKKPVSKHSKTRSYKCIMWGAIIMRGIFGGIVTLLIFQAAMLLPIGDVQSLMALNTAVTPFLAFLFFRDALTRMHLVALCGALVGVVLIVQPSFIFREESGIAQESESTHESKGKVALGYACAISGSFVQACVYICIQFTRKVPVYLLTMSQSINGILVGLIVLAYMHAFGTVLWIDSWADVAYLAILGGVGYTYLWFLTMSGKYITSGVVALLMNLSIVWAYLVQIVAFHQKPTWITIVGAVCMSVSAAIVSADKVHDAKKRSMSVIQKNAVVTGGA